jgi:glycopeptide antibiotics resistance protein
MVTNRNNFIFEESEISNMNDFLKELLLKGYEWLTVILPFLFTFAILSLVYKYKKIPHTKGRFLKISVFIIYIFFVFYFTGVGTMFDLQQYGIRLTTDKINLLPFSRDIDIVAYFLNILLFAPFGFFYPFVWQNANKLKYTVLSGFSFSLLIELSQLLNNRQTDVDDLLMNTLGTLIGYLMFSVFIRVTKRTVHSVNYIKYEPEIYILAIFLGHFLTFNEFGLAKILYGF